DRPVEETLGVSQRVVRLIRASFLDGDHDEPDVLRRHLRYWLVPEGRNQVAADVPLDLPALPLGRKLLLDEVLRNCGKGGSAAAALLLLRAPLLLFRVSALLDQVQPYAGLLAGGVEGHPLGVANRP